VQKGKGVLTERSRKTLKTNKKSQGQALTNKEGQTGQGVHPAPTPKRGLSQGRDNNSLDLGEKGGTQKGGQRQEDRSSLPERLPETITGEGPTKRREEEGRDNLTAREKRPVKKKGGGGRQRTDLSGKKVR